MSRRIYIFAGIVAVAVTCLLLWRTHHDSDSALPYADGFVAGRTEEWKGYGGVWSPRGDVMINSSDERGAKLMTGSEDWRNYTVQAEVMLATGESDAGLIADASQEELGVDSYRGYYAGLRTRDHSLVLGRADHGWRELGAMPLPGGVSPSVWYALSISSADCVVQATATNLATGGKATILSRAMPCLSSGRIGLRSYSTGGAWRHVHVTPLRQSLGSPGVSATAVLPTPGGTSAVQRSPVTQAELDQASGHVVAIRDLLLQGYQAAATVRGTVTLTAPALYIDDGSGGVRVEADAAHSLRVGDEVETSGTVHREQFNAVLRNAKLRFLWPGDPPPPVSVAAQQAATGSVAARFIQTEGTVLSAQKTGATGYEIVATSGGHLFHASIVAGSADEVMPAIRRNSFVRFRGVCSVSEADTHGVVPFVLLLRSAQDLQVLKGPPWWGDWRLPVFATALILLLLSGYVLLLRIRHAQLRAVLAERGRFAHEIHDTMAQAFAGLEFQLRAIRRTLPTGSTQQLTQQVELASQMVRHSHDEARRNIAVLRPETLSELDLLSHLRIGADHLVSGGGVQVETHISGTPVALPLAIKDAAFRIGLEALANAVRHGHPSCIRIAVDYLPSELRVSIHDDGQGFAPESIRDGFGVAGMHTRAKRIGATLSVESSRGRGTTVTLTAHLPRRPRSRIWHRLLIKAGAETPSHV